jgi:UDP-glucuronate 4-epimerase
VRVYNDIRLVRNGPETNRPRGQEAKDKSIMVKYNLDLSGKTIVVTGSSGFIGSNLCLKLMEEWPDAKIIGIDNMNHYYDIRLKELRLQKLVKNPQFTFILGDISDKDTIDRVFADYKPQIIVNLAAQAGVRWSLVHPEDYIKSNIVGFYNILEASRHSYDGLAEEEKAVPVSAQDYAKGVYHGVEHLVYASSSSVYGGNVKYPFSTDDPVDTPVSLYAATKKSDELMAHCYSKLYGIPSTGLRFFSVIGPAGRPDMALFKFTDIFREGGTVEIYNYGKCRRDFTYVGDIVEGVTRVMRYAPAENSVGARYNVYNIGNSNPVELLDFVKILEEELVRAKIVPSDYDFDAHSRLVPAQPGDVVENYADVTPLIRDFDYKPKSDLRDVIREFCEWYAGFYGTI